MMKRKETLYRFLLRYGVAVVLLLMMAGIIYLLQIIQIKNKVSVDVICNDTHSNYTAYVNKETSFQPMLEKNIEIATSEKKKLFFRVHKIVEEPSFIVLELTPEMNLEPLYQAFAGNTKLSGYIFTDEVKLWELIFNKGILSKKK